MFHLVDYIRLALKSVFIYATVTKTREKSKLKKGAVKKSVSFQIMNNFSERNVFVSCNFWKRRLLYRLYVDFDSFSEEVGEFTTHNLSASDCDCVSMK